MSTIFSIFLVTVLFLVGMTLFGDYRADYLRQKELEYASISVYHSVHQDDKVFEISFTGRTKSTKTVRIYEGQYLADAMDLMGGFHDNYDTRCINTLYQPSDSGSFYVPARNKEDKVSLSKATLEEFMSMPGIGKVIGQRLVDYRDENGRFEYLEEITKISGVGWSVFNNIKDEIML
jgi:competence protein ComEA